MRVIAVWIPTLLAILTFPFLLLAFTQNPQLIWPTEASILIPLAIFPGPVSLTWISSEFLGESVSLWGFFFFHFLAALQFPIYVGIANAILVLGFPRSPVVQLLLSPLLIHMGWMTLLLIPIFLSRLGF